VEQGRDERLWGAQATARAASWRPTCWRRSGQISAVRGPEVRAPEPRGQPMLRAGNILRQPERRDTPAHGHCLQQAVHGDPC